MQVGGNLVREWRGPWLPISAGMSLASFPDALGNWGEERLVSAVRACAAPQVFFVGNLETTVIPVRVARPYITETRESFTSTRHSSVQPSRAVRPQ